MEHGFSRPIRPTKQGFIAVCPDLFWRFEPGLQLSDHKESDWKKGLDFYGRYDFDIGVKDIAATIAAARKDAEEAAAAAREAAAREAEATAAKARAEAENVAESQLAAARADGVEVRVGVVQEPVFGPLVVFGLSGLATELLGGRARNEVDRVPEVDVARTIDDDQRQLMIKNLLGKPAEQIAITAHPMVEDSAEFAKAIATQLLVLGWQVRWVAAAMFVFMHPLV